MTRSDAAAAKEAVRPLVAAVLAGSKIRQQGVIRLDTAAPANRHGKTVANLKTWRVLHTDFFGPESAESSRWLQKGCVGGSDSSATGS